VKEKTPPPRQNGGEGDVEGVIDEDIKEKEEISQHHTNLCNSRRILPDVLTQRSS
jgi:phosphatidylethanolamine-binding protein (PEBP) family uncharacterized protein